MSAGHIILLHHCGTYHH